MDITEGTLELTAEEAGTIRGGTAVQVAAFLATCFGAGFNFGYNSLGPRLLG